LLLLPQAAPQVLPLLLLPRRLQPFQLGLSPLLPLLLLCCR
jgi:hypothetical protein